jgi:hypothetical protein
MRKKHRRADQHAQDFFKNDKSGDTDKGMKY